MTRTQSARAADRRAPVLSSGAVAGVVGGVCYVVFVEVVNLAANGAAAFFHPFRQIGAVILGPRALSASYDLAVAASTGTALHLAIAALFGILVAWAVVRISAQSISGTVGLGLVAGLAFYALDVFVIFPAAFPWFLENSRVTQSIGHALFGMVTGAWLVFRTSPDPQRLP